MKPVSLEQPKELVHAELADVEPLTHFRDMTVLLIRGDDCPHTLLEIGRLREAGFRAVGAGRGSERDLDALDYGLLAYQQLVAYDPARRELVAMLRLQYGRRAIAGGDALLRTSQLFDYSALMRRDIIPAGIELGRSVVNAQATRARWGLFALWRGLARLVSTDTSLRYLFGNVSLYDTFQPLARDRLIALVEAIYAPPEPLLLARPGLRSTPSDDAATGYRLAGKSARERIDFLRHEVSALGERIPLMLQSYLSLGSGIWLGQSARDSDFGDAVEIGIVVPVAAIEQDARRRFEIQR